MKNLKIYIAILGLFLLTNNLSSAQTTPKSSIEISPYINTSDASIPVEAQNLLYNKLGEILTQNGIIKGVNTVFILTANTVVLTQDITPTSPSMHVYTFQTTFYLGNGIDGNLFSSYTTNLKGIGTNQTKAYINAFRSISAKNEEISTFLNNAKAKVIDYYNAKCDNIMSQVSMLEKTNKYQDALYLLTSIPDVASSCYTKSNARIEAVYKKAIDFDCKSKLAEAQLYWNANPNSDGANQAAEILREINPNSTCFKDVKSFGAIISKKMNENDAREWNLFYQQEVGLEKDRIEAIKEIGKAYGQGQPQNVNYNTKYWW